MANDEHLQNPQNYPFKITALEINQNKAHLYQITRIQNSEVDIVENAQITGFSNLASGFCRPLSHNLGAHLASCDHFVQTSPFQR